LGEKVDDDLQSIKEVIKEGSRSRQKNKKQVRKGLLGTPPLHANFPKPTRRLGQGHGA
jgi:hypothetical protein